MSLTRRAQIGTVCALLAVGGCRVSTLRPTVFPVRYAPMGSASEITVAPACAGIRTLQVSDARAGQKIIGQRTLQDRAGSADITIDGEIEPWVRAGIQRAMNQSKLVEGSSFTSTLTVKLSSLSVKEVAFRNSEYAGQVVLEIELSDGAAGAPWSLRADGVAQNYGRPGNALNYQETINHALDRAAAKLVNDSGLRDRLCQRK